MNVISLHSFAQSLIKKYNLDLSGLSVLTEIASGAYLYNPCIALLAGAERVYVYGKDSAYGMLEDIQKDFFKIVPFNMREKVIIVDELSNDVVSQADIITNSGHLRPFNKNFIFSMKPTAALPLMWEPWEIREGEINFQAAQERGVLILGTNEHEAPCDMRPYSFLMALNLMLEHGFCLIDSKILIIGDQFSLAVAIEEGMKKCDLKCERVSMETLRLNKRNILHGVSYLLIAEHSSEDVIIGSDGILTAEDLVEFNIGAIGVIAGSIKDQECRDLGISVFPNEIKPHGYMSYLPSSMGSHAVMDLFAAGLRVGEVSTRSRLGHMDISSAAKFTLENAPALDLLGDLSWIKQ